MYKPKAIIFDLDGTLCELNSPLEQYNHTRFDKSIENMKHIFNALDKSNEFHMVILTGRKADKWKDLTYLWIQTMQNLKPDRIILQEKSTAQPNHIFKKEALKTLQEEYDIIALIDDNPNLIPVCKDLKILLLQVHNGI